MSRCREVRERPALKLGIDWGTNEGIVLFPSDQERPLSDPPPHIPARRQREEVRELAPSALSGASVWFRTQQELLGSSCLRSGPWSHSSLTPSVPSTVTGITPLEGLLLHETQGLSSNPTSSCLSYPKGTPSDRCPRELAIE